jgi:hypothetical protein
MLATSMATDRLRVFLAQEISRITHKFVEKESILFRLALK